MFLLDEHGSGSVNWKKNLVVLWIGVFLGCASFTACIPFLPVYLLTELHVPQDQVNFWSGLAFAATFLAASVMAPYWGAWADRVGQRRMAIRASLGLATTYMLGAIVQTAPQMVGVRVLTGLISGFIPASMSLVSSTLPKEKLGWGMGWMQAAVASGNILGPLLGGYLSVWFGMRTSFFAGSACLFFVSLMVIFLVRDIPISKEEARREMHIVRDVKLALRNRGLLYVMFMFFLVQTCIMIIQPLITLYVNELMGGLGDESVTMSGWIFSMAGIAGIIASPYWGKRGQRRGFVKTLCLVLFCAGCVNLCQVFVRSVWEFAAIQFVYGLFLAGAVPNINSTLVEVTPLEMRGKAFGLTTSAQQFGGVVGPLLGGFLGDHMATKYVLFSTGVLLLLAAGYTFLARLRKVG
jgi:DHA1 family multidrug resistance protein-like MFS transporter